MFCIQRGLFILFLSFLLITTGCSSQANPPNQADKSVESPGTPEGASASTINKSGTADSADSKTANKTVSEADTTVMSNVTAIRLINETSGWAGGKGWIARTDNNGEKWSVQYHGGQAVEQLFALNGKEAWAVVDGSNQSAGRSLLHTTDGGAHWLPAGKMPNGDFLHFTSEDDAIAANAYSSDGGKTWKQLKVPSDIVGDAYFHDKDHGWAVVQEDGKALVRHTVDGGKVWETVMSRNTPYPLNGALIRSAGVADAWVEWIGDSGMTQTSYSLFHTDNEGQSWQTVIANETAGGGPAPGVPSGSKRQGHKNQGSKPGMLYVVNTKTAFMGGFCPACDKPNTVGWTTDGGKTWNNGKEQFSGLKEALLGMADAQHGWLICKDQSESDVMFVTSDGAKSWRNAHVFSLSK